MLQDHHIVPNPPSKRIMASRYLRPDSKDSATERSGNQWKRQGPCALQKTVRRSPRDKQPCTMEGRAVVQELGPFTRPPLGVVMGEWKAEGVFLSLEDAQRQKARAFQRCWSSEQKDLE